MARPHIPSNNDFNPDVSEYIHKFTITINQFLLLLQIADFGFSKEITSESMIASSVGSLLYSSPEIVNCKPYEGPECDIWSLGVILYIMLTATMPFDDSNMGEFLVKVENATYSKPTGVSDGK
jgi:serine/threonine protein kinase